ncbi:MAG: B12-binding domain-containing radical SAM protein [Candidatus Omnitrophota bacterium]
MSLRKRRRLRIVIPIYPAFNIYSSIARTTTSLGPVCVASSAAEVPGWDVEVIDENNLRRYGPRGPDGGADHKLLQRIRPADVVGFYGGLTSTIPRLYEIAAFYKQQGVLTIAGGQHFLAENIAEALSSGIDYVVVGEGEETIKDILLAIDNKKGFGGIKGLAYFAHNGVGDLRQDNRNVVFTPSRPPLLDFDRFPLGDFSLVRYARISLYPVGRIRGCGMECEFCTVKGRPRPASPERLLENISLLLETRDARNFFIVDDLFGQQREETIRLCHMLKKYQQDVGKRLNITVQIRLDKGKDKELLVAMRDAGINTVAIGFESPIAEELSAMRKRIRPEEMIDLARRYRKAGFLVHGMFIFGYPAKEGVDFVMSANERARRFKAFIKSSGINTVQVLLPVPLSGTELKTRLQKEGRIYSLRDIGWEYYDGNFPLFSPDSPMTPEQMQISIRRIMGRFYRFRHIFMVGLHIFSFPGLIFFLHNIKLAWNRWRCAWRNHIIRFGGWAIIQNWTSQLKKGYFSQRLERAKRNLGK